MSRVRQTPRIETIATYRIAEPQGGVTGTPVPGAPSGWDATGVVAHVEAAGADDPARASLVARVFAAAHAVAPVTTGPDLIGRFDDLLPHLGGRAGVRSARADLLADGTVALPEVGPAEAIAFQYATLSELVGLLDGVREVLLQVGPCAVYHTPAGLFVTGDVERPGGSGITDRPRVEGLADGRWVRGGRLPPGATRAVGAASGNGVWLAVTEDDDAPVRFEDDAGAIVAPPLPAGARSEPVPDATEACPACDGREWLHVTDPRGETLVCARCGYAVGMWTFYAPLRPA